MSSFTSLVCICCASLIYCSWVCLCMYVCRSNLLLMTSSGWRLLLVTRVTLTAATANNMSFMDIRQQGCPTSVFLHFITEDNHVKESPNTTTVVSTRAEMISWLIENSFATVLIISLSLKSLYYGKITNIWWFQLLRCEDLTLLYDCKLTIIWFWTVGHLEIMMGHFSLFSYVLQTRWFIHSLRK